MEYIQSENYLCFATLIEMILKDIGIREYTRFDFAKDLGITLPPSESGMIGRVDYTNDEFDWGIRVDSEKINTLFYKRGINLQTKYVHVTPYTMIREEVQEWNQCYVIFLFSYGELFGKSDLQKIGHAALFVNMPNQQEVCIYDPGPRESGEKNVDCYRLEEAMYQRRAGYILVQKV